MSARRWALALAVLALAWTAAGVRRIDGARELAVLDGPLLAGRAARVDGAWVVAPPGLLRCTRYPLGPLELELPSATEIVARDGSRFRVAGRARVRIDGARWRLAHEAAGGRGVAGLLGAALAEAGAGLEPPRARRLTPTRERRLETGLRAALAARGTELLALELGEVIRSAGVGAGEAGSDAPRLLIVGLDGADWQVVDGLIERGRLPNLARLVRDGTRAKLLSISPLLSPVVWTSVATGVEPTRHGVLDFLVDDPQGGEPQPVTSAHRRVPAVWELLSRAGHDVGVVGWWASWPAEPVRGYVVSDRLAYQLFGFEADPDDPRGKTWPPDLYETLRPLVAEPGSIGWERVQGYLAGSRSAESQFDADELRLVDEFRTLLASGDTYLAIARELSRRFRPQLELVYFEGTDTVGHLFMPYRPPRRSSVSTARAESFGAMVDRYYETADGFLGELLRDREEEWNVIVLSDHGFASDATRPRATDSRIGHGAAADWHRRFGVLVMSGPAFRSGERIEEASVYDIAPTVLALFGQPIPRSWPGRVLDRALRPEFLARRPVGYRADDPERQRQATGAVQDPAAEDLIRKLQGLGYVGDAGATGEARTARNNAAVSLLAQGRYVEAEDELRAAVGSRTDLPVLMVNLGFALRLQGRTDEAREQFERAMSHTATRRAAGNQIAELRLDAGDLAGAERLVRELLEEEPDAAELHNTLGLILEAGGRIAAAETTFRRSAELDPDAAQARNNLGNLEQRRGDSAAAERWYLRAIEADPYFMGAYNNLALVYQRRGETAQAIDLYDRALAKAPDNAIVLNNLASLDYATGDLGEAERLWRRATVAAPDYPSPWNNLAGLAIAGGELEEAERLLDRALRLDPDYGDARINRSLVHRAGGRVDDAAAELRRALADPRSRPQAARQLGLLELTEGRPQAAIEALEIALEHAPRDVSLWNAVGEARWRAGRPAAAREAWLRSLELRPAQPTLRRRLQEAGAP